MMFPFCMTIISETTKKSLSHGISMGQTVNTNLRYHPNWQNARSARTIMRSAGITAAAAVGYYSPSGFLPALVSPFTARSAAALSPIRGSLKVSCAITPLTQRFRNMVAIIAPFFRLSRGNCSQCPQKFRLQVAATLQRGGDLPQQRVPIPVEGALQRQVVAGVVGAEHGAFTVHVL